LSYLDQANLAADEDFGRRLAAAVAQEAKPKPDDDNFANSILRNPAEGGRMFMPFIVAEPGFDTAFANGGQLAILDGMILSALQANWSHVEAVYFPPAVTP
jgi:hypothetical protein